MIGIVVIGPPPNWLRARLRAARIHLGLASPLSPEIDDPGANSVEGVVLKLAGVPLVPCASAPEPACTSGWGKGPSCCLASRGACVECELKAIAFAVWIHVYEANFLMRETPARLHAISSKPVC